MITPKKNSWVVKLADGTIDLLACKAKQRWIRGGPPLVLDFGEIEQLVRKRNLWDDRSTSIPEIDDHGSR